MSILLIGKCFFVFGKFLRTLRTAPKNRALAFERQGGVICNLLLFLFFTGLFAAALAGQRLLQALLFARLQVKRVPLYLFDDVFRLHFALEAAKRVLQRLALLHSNFSQSKTPPNLSS